ncbi:LysR substrate-binding domain-containing protein [Mesorhizobium sp. 1B3]|uniref:LysR substrate-binding domain-containing protein n=1 Tax=Mesorhizobium sp. 1B3 TaxID=3243599 RepID=UPI003D962703
MGFRLPPVNALRLFEAAARLESFKLAAQEIHITPSAVSHGIRTLEEWIGVELFLRGPRGLALTESGIAYAAEVRRALTILSNATESLSGRRSVGALSVGAPAPFANYWLLPRLATFTSRHPDIQVRLHTAENDTMADMHRCDLTIKIRSSPGEGGAWIELMPQELVPVCAPAFLMNRRDVTDATLISRGPVVQVASDTADWMMWFEAKGLQPEECDRSVCVDSEQLALEAAVRGLGITLGRRPLVDNHLESGALVEIGGPSIVADRRYWLVGSTTLRDRPDVKLFRAWLINEARQARAGGWRRDESFIPSHTSRARPDAARASILEPTN